MPFKSRKKKKRSPAVSKSVTKAVRTVTKSNKSLMGKMKDLAKETKLISRGLMLTGNPMASGLARVIGFGKKKKPRRRKRKSQKGGSIFGKILGGVASIPGGVIIGGTAGGLQALKGLGKKQRGRKQKGGAMIPEWNMGNYLLRDRAPLIGGRQKGGFVRANGIGRRLRLSDMNKY